MRTPITAAATAWMMLSASFVHAREPVVLRPTSPWVVNYAENSCRLIRSFGTDDNQVRLEFRMFAPGEFFWVMLSGEPIGASWAGSGRISYRFDPDNEDVSRVFAMRGTTGDKVPAIIFPASLLPTGEQREASKARKKNLEDHIGARDKFDIEREVQVDELEVGVSGRRVALQLGSMRPPLDVMRNCMNDLIASWGIDTKVQEALSRPPVPTDSPQKWLGPSDYPLKMLMQGRSDRVDFRLTVDATGTPTDCNVLTMESRPEFIKATCDMLMKRARFQPALDAKGTPVPSYYVNTVQFVIGY